MSRDKNDHFEQGILGYYLVFSNICVCVCIQILYIKIQIYTHTNMRKLYTYEQEYTYTEQIHTSVEYI